jgi:hypothetical protein
VPTDVIEHMLGLGTTFETAFKLLLKPGRYWSIFIALLVLNFSVDTDLAPQWSRLYHIGWSEHYRVLFPWVTLCAIASLCFCQSRGGLISMIMVCGILLLFFFLFSGAEEASWPMFVWFSYRTALAMLAGIVPSVVQQSLGTTKAPIGQPRSHNELD